MPQLGFSFSIGWVQKASEIPDPAPTVLPAITGDAQQGSTLTCSTGTWTGSPMSYAYQWRSAGANVGTNANAYIPVAADVGNLIECIVTATNASGGAGDAQSASVGGIFPQNGFSPDGVIVFSYDGTNALLYQ